MRKDPVILAWTGVGEIAGGYLIASSSAWSQFASTRLDSSLSSCFLEFVRSHPRPYFHKV